MFDEIKLAWGGRDYVIAPNRVLGAIAAVEEHITMVELMRHVVAGTTPVARLAFAHTALLNYAGVQVGSDEVYEWLIGDPNELMRLSDCLNTILAMMMPPSVRGVKSEEAHPTMGVVKSSRKVTRR